MMGSSHSIVFSESILDHEIEIKRAELETLENELFQKELDLATLKGELAAFDRKYMRVVGGLQAELDELDAQVAEILFIHNPGDQVIAEDAHQARFFAQESARVAGEWKGDVKGRKHAAKRKEIFQPSLNIKQYYREIAKRIHPDLATDEGERLLRTRLMIEANLAFQDGDEARLRSILKHWENSPEKVKGEDAQSKLMRLNLRIAHVCDRLSVIEDEHRQLLVSDIYQIRIEVEHAELLGVDLLRAMAERLMNKIVSCKARLRDLVFVEHLP